MNKTPLGSGARPGPVPIKTYTLLLRTQSADETAAIHELLWAYRRKVNAILQDLWASIKWTPRSLKGKGQMRLLPTYRHDKASTQRLRNQQLEGWQYAAHWVDSALKTAFSILASWRKNYVRGRRTRRCPHVRRCFARVKQTLLKLEGDRLRITLAPHTFATLDLSHRYFRLPSAVSASGIGEPILTPDKVHLPIHVGTSGNQKNGVDTQAVPAIAWDANLLSFDGYAPETGWVRIDTRGLASAHIATFHRRRTLQRMAKSRSVRRVLQKCCRRERNRARKHQVEIARVMRQVAGLNGFEALDKERLYRKSRVWNRRVARTDWRGIRRLTGGCEVPPHYTSKTCSRCGWTNKDLRGQAVFACESCGLRLDRQLNAAVNLYRRMGGVPPDPGWWDRVVLPSLGGGGYVATGVERKGADELGRSLQDAVKPQIYYAYDRWADAYLPKPT
jgi:putative transposase